MVLHKNQYPFIIINFNKKVRKKECRMTALKNFGIDTQNDRGDMCVRFEERNNSKIMNTVVMTPRCTKLSTSHSYFVHLSNVRVNQYLYSFIPYTGKL